jgi:hypothetical protein
MDNVGEENVRKKKDTSCFRSKRRICRHLLFKTIALCQVILDYLQFEDAILIYNSFKCKQPDRPCLSTKLIHNLLTTKNALPLSISPNIEKWYIPHEEIEISNNKLDFICVVKLPSTDIYWQCPDCQEYKRIEFRLGNKIGNYAHKGFALKTVYWKANYLCICSAEKLVKKEKFKFYNIEEKFIVSTMCIANNNYNSSRYSGKDLLSEITQKNYVWEPQTSYYL